MTQLESSIEDYLARCVEALGGEHRKVTFQGRRGAPDRLVMLPPNIAAGRPLPRTFWVELKKPGLAATFPNDAHERQQAREHDRLRKMGQQVFVVDSKDAINALLK